ncbi:hypothetical protein AU198_11715 [Mycobacterium sp. GA-1199]|nr:hypothetical protein AU198_11715 [Mycobacterium sp. GA-1199]
MLFMSRPAREAASSPSGRHNGCVHNELEPNRRMPVWRDPLSAGFRAHRHLLLLRLRWHERRGESASTRH